MLDFLGFLYLSIIINFIQIIVAIVAIFGLCLYKPKLLIAVSITVWQRSGERAVGLIQYGSGMGNWR